MKRREFIALTRQRGGGVAARGAGAAVGDAGDWRHVSAVGSDRGAQHCGVSARIARAWDTPKVSNVRDRVSVCRRSGRSISVPSLSIWLTREAAR